MNTIYASTQYFWARVEITGGCWFWRGTLSRTGYGRVLGGRSGARRYMMAHQMSWILANGSIPSGLFVCHSCDVPNCVRPDHLWLGTNADNMRDKNEKGRQARGERSGNATLTQAQVVAIRNSAEKVAVLSVRYGVNAAAISAVRTGRTWKHVNVIAPPSTLGVKRGEEHVCSKITELIAREIRESSERGVVLARRFGISQQSVCDIRKRRTWDWID